MVQKLQTLFSVLVCYRHNLHMLHWKVVGHHFEGAHTLLDSYVSKFNTFIDEIGEMILSMDGNPLTLQECIDIVTQLDQHILIIESGEDYDSTRVYNALDIMFTDLYNLYTEISKDCEFTDCTSVLDEHKYWLRIEGKYKNKKRMKN